MSRVALLQVDVSDSETPESRVPRVLDLVDQQKGKCDLVVLPELWNIGAFNSGALETYAQPRDGELVTALQARAKAGNFWLHGGSFVERLAESGMANTAVLINPAGEIIKFYRKHGLFLIKFSHWGCSRISRTFSSNRSSKNHFKNVTASCPTLSWFFCTFLKHENG
jgi:predicted amidohydrolase